METNSDYWFALPTDVRTWANGWLAENTFGTAQDDPKANFIEELENAAYRAERELQLWAYEDDGRDYIQSGTCPMCGLAYFDFPVECSCVGPCFAPTNRVTAYIPSNTKLGQDIEDTVRHLYRMPSVVHMDQDYEDQITFLADALFRLVEPF